jgi:hypothetical protein
MICRAAAPVFVMLAALAGEAAASTLPAVKTGPGNAVASCATPGRLMTFQMLLETGNLSFQRGDGRRGDVHPSQNNFAGLGAVGHGEPGERFPTVSAGVKAHLQHLLLYAGDRIDNPIAERTRKVQEWGILTSWQKGLRGPVTFTDLARKWAPGDRGYGAKIAAIGAAFYENVCSRPDPRPELVAEARNGRSADARLAATDNRKPGMEIMKRSVDAARAEGSAERLGLGGTALAQQEVETPAARTLPPSALAREPDGRTDQAPAVKTAAAAAGAARPAGAAAASSKCRVWTASYGGQKAVIIKAVSDGFVNYTVLDVNEGAEKREIDAYIAAYAKGGQPLGEFANQPSALDRAFELCPEG